MNTSSQGNTAPPKQCQFCDRKGLPILPLRYAIARKDMGNAPPLEAPFEVGAGEKSKAVLALPANQAFYTLRLLRPGYLYVYDEHRKEWSAYQVAQGGYLFQFDPHAKAPPGGFGQATFSCARTADAMIARCITVKDAASATRIWLGYSDVAWTAAVLAKHANVAYREAHMRSVDVATVRNGGKQPHATGFDELGERVAEYATTPAKLNAETASYVARFLPAPYKTPSTLLSNTSDAQMALKMCSKLVVDLLPYAQPGHSQPQGRTPSAAWAFSATDIEADGAAATTMQAWAETAAKPYQGALVGLDDPAGLAMEINGLAVQLSAEFCEEPERKWRHETALIIASLKEAIMHGAVEDDIKSEVNAAKVIDGLSNAADPSGDSHALEDMVTLATKGASGLMQARNARDKEREESYTKIKEQAEFNANSIGEAEWKKKYASLFNEKAQQDELSSTGGYAKALQQFAEKKINPLDATFLGWLKSDGFFDYFTHNFDAQDIDSGLSYIAVLSATLNQSGGRTATVEYLTKAIQEDPTNPRALFARGFALNQDALAKKWVEVAAEKANESEAGKTLAEISEKVYDGYKGLIVEGNKGEVFNGLAKYIYQLSASVVNALGSEVTSMVSAGVGRLLSTRRIYGLLGAVAHEEDPNLIIVNLSGSVTPRQAARIISRALGQVLGGGPNQYVSAAQKVLSDKPGSFQGVLLIDKDKAESMLKAKGGRTLSKVQIGNVVEAQALETAVHGMAGKLVNGEVKGGVVGAILVAITCKFAYAEYADAKGDEKLKQGTNFFAGALPSLVGGGFEIAGSLVEKTSFGATKLTAPLKIVSVRFGSVSEWLCGVGKMMGVIGGVVASTIIVMDGAEEYSDGHHALGFSHVILGGASFLSAALLLTTFAAAGFIVGVIIGIILLLISIFKQNKVQNWLENTKFFGDGKLKPFESPVEQMLSLSLIGQA